jgi:hypothetical protein
MGVRCWPFREAQQADLSVSFGESSPSNSIHQRRYPTQSRHHQAAASRECRRSFCCHPSLGSSRHRTHDHRAAPDLPRYGRRAPTFRAIMTPFPAVAELSSKGVVTHSAVCCLDGPHAAIDSCIHRRLIPIVASNSS